LDAGIVGSNPTRGMDVYVYVYVYSIFVLSCVGRGLAMSGTESFMDAPCSSGSQKGNKKSTN
jgi:L-amino acid N-acyltransferase YncA